MRTTLLGLALVLLSVHPTAAEPITLTFGGNISASNAWIAEPLIGIAAEPGDVFSLSLGFVPPPDTDASPTFGTYALAGELELKVGGERFASGYTATAHTVDFPSGNTPDVEDRFSIGISKVLEQPDFFLSIDFPTFAIPRSGWLTSDALPLSQADWKRLEQLSETPQLGYFLSYTPGGGELFSVLDGSITRVSVSGPVSPVPEPATVLLLGTGLLAGFVRRWHQQKRV